jgi:class 3 adenylate cyclase
LFTDIVKSTDRVAELGDRRWRELVSLHDAIVRRQLERYRGHEVKTMGDGFLATFDGPARAIECANAVVDATRRQGIDVRAGLHTGEIELRPDDVGGLGVHIAQRVCAAASPHDVLVSRTVTDLVAGSEIRFLPKGDHTLKGVPGVWPLFAVDNG